MIAMQRLLCLWVRPRLGPLADGALAPRVARWIDRHRAGCSRCATEVARLRALRDLVRAAARQPADPDWTGFWSGVRHGIAQGTPPAVRDPWWLPFWRPVWGHPRLALSGALAAALVLTLSLWPVDDDGRVSSAWAGPVVVHDVSTPDPERTVMVYSSPDRSLTVIWLFTPPEPQ